MDSATTVERAFPSFLTGGGELGRLIARLDWGATSLGPIDRWRQVTKTTVGLILRSPVPIVTLWGSDGVMIYNDAYAEFAHRFPDRISSYVMLPLPHIDASLV